VQDASEGLTDAPAKPHLEEFNRRDDLESERTSISGLGEAGGDLRVAYTALVWKQNSCISYSSRLRFRDSLAAAVVVAAAAAAAVSASACSITIKTRVGSHSRFLRLPESSRSNGGLRWINERTGEYDDGGSCLLRSFRTGTP